ncbi:MAG: hypothetical protein Ta2D_03050 [Rickettsiales bacterium]|nr:MAG: hypothetical protein Ta2D_03050 [Rickettsiales bacterium]
MPDIIAYLGPIHSFTYEITSLHYGENELISYNNITDIFNAVEKKEVDFAVVPLRNSIHGDVEETHKNLLEKSDIKILKELVLDVRMQLCSKSPIEKVEKICTKYVAYNQCVKSLAKLNLADIPFEDVESTSLGAEIASNDLSVAAICSQLAATQYGLNTLFANIEDTNDNKTTFGVIKL